MAGDPCRPIRDDLTRVQQNIQELEATLASGVHLTAAQNVAIRSQIDRRTRQAATLQASLETCTRNAYQDRGDASFGGTGEIVLQHDSSVRVIGVVGAVEQPGGKIVALAQGVPGERVEIVCYDPATERNDPEFGQQGSAVDDLSRSLVPPPVSSWYAKSIAAQKDGKIVMVGWGALGEPGAFIGPGFDACNRTAVLLNCVAVIARDGDG